MEAVINVQQLHKHYHPNSPAPVRALDGVTFQVPRGAIFGLLGPNGAGKSTLVKILSTITSPTAGRASILGFDVTTQSLEARRQMAVVLQQNAAETLLTVRDNLLIYAYLHGLDRADAHRRMEPVLDEFDLRSHMAETVQELSLGTKRRIQVAKIFMLDTPIIILDEATTGMDPLMKRSVMDRLRREAARGRTVLLTTQVLSEAEELCDTIMILNSGKTLASGTLQDLRQLSQQMFRVSLSLGEMNEDINQRLQALNPVELKVEGTSVEMLFKGEEASLLGKLAELARLVPIRQFEVKGPDLEEIFIALLKDDSR